MTFDALAAHRRERSRRRAPPATVPLCPTTSSAPTSSSPTRLSCGRRPPPRLDGVRITRQHPPQGELSRWFYAEVGGPYSWLDHSHRSTEEWQAWAQSVGDLGGDRRPPPRRLLRSGGLAPPPGPPTRDVNDAAPKEVA